MSYCISGESNNITIITLPPLGSLSPIIELKSITEELSDKYKVITLEPFGYGFSDKIETERTIENISSEYYEGVKKIGVDKYYLMADSISGIYALQWALDHPDEVLGFIGFDTAVPGQDAMTQDEINYYRKLNGLKKVGVLRMISIFKSDTTLSMMDKSYKNYTEEEKNIEKLLFVNRGYTDTVLNEVSHINDNFEKIKNKKFPEKFLC